MGTFEINICGVLHLNEESHDGVWHQTSATAWPPPGTVSAEELFVRLNRTPSPSFQRCNELLAPAEAGAGWVGRAHSWGRPEPLVANLTGEAQTWKLLTVSLHVAFQSLVILTPHTTTHQLFKTLKSTSFGSRVQMGPTCPLCLGSASVPVVLESGQPGPW